MASSVFSGPLWRHGDFLKLWAAQSVSAFGSRITREGLPFLAVMTLDATPAQLGVLAALSMGPSLIVGLLAGGFVDRTRRKAILVWTDLFRVAVLMTVPIAAWSNLLTIEQVYGVAAAVGAASVLFDLADNAFLPSLIGRDDLLEGNAKLSLTESVAEIGGPALAGLLFQVFTAPVALAANAGTYLVSALLLGGIRTREAEETRPPRERHWAADLSFGLKTILEQPLIRPLLFMTVIQSFFWAFFGGLYALFALKTLGLTPALLGITIAVGGVGALLGSIFSPWLIRRLGVGPAIVVSLFVAGASAFFIPLAPPDLFWGTAFMMAAQLLGDSFSVAALIPISTLQQTVIAPRSLGRTGAIFHVTRGAVGVAGAVAGGLLAGVIGVRETLYIACAGITVASMICVFSPLGSLRDFPAPQHPRDDAVIP